MHVGECVREDTGLLKPGMKILYRQGCGVEYQHFSPGCLDNGGFPAGKLFVLIDIIRKEGFAVYERQRQIYAKMLGNESIFKTNDRYLIGCLTIDTSGNTAETHISEEQG